MAIDFPNSPTQGQRFTDALGATWVWDSVKWVGVGGGPFLPLAGGTMSGPILAADPAQPTELANKEYVDTSGTAVPISGIIIWPSTTIPPNYLRCDGSTYNITDAPLLFAKIGAAFGGDGVTTFAVPPTTDRTVVGAGYSWALAASGGEINHTLSVGEMPSHAHSIADPGHAHSLADPGHSHGIGDPGHNHGFPDPGHAHSTNPYGSGLWAHAGPGAVTSTYPSVTNMSDASIAASGTGRYIQAAATGIWTGGVGTGQWVYGAGTGIGIYGAGSSYAHNNMPPFLALIFIIRFK